jgi:hypothetical protein
MCLLQTDSAERPKGYKSTILRSQELSASQKEQMAKGKAEDGSGLPPKQARESTCLAAKKSWVLAAVPEEEARLL